MSVKQRSSLLRNRAYEQIRSQLVLGDLHAGSEISEPRLVKKLGIGRTPIREALQQLEIEGLLVRSPRKGTVVRVPQRQDIVDLFEAREGIESHAALLAAKRIGPADLARLLTLCNQMNSIAERMKTSGVRALDKGMLKQFLAADLGFHTLLISATGNLLLMKIVSDSHALSRIFCTLRQEHTYEIVSGAHRLHSEILKALEASDGEKARLLMIDHIRHSCSEALEHFDNQQREASRTESGIDRLLIPADLLEEYDRMGLLSQAPNTPSQEQGNSSGNSK